MPFEYQGTKTRRFPANSPRKSNPPRQGNSFADAVRAAIVDEKVLTTNGMTARKTTGDAVLDFFTKAGASRGKLLTDSFSAALAEDETLAIRALLWTRDITEGAGERKQFRDMLQVLERHNAYTAGQIMTRIPELGRWDDLFSYRDPVNARRAVELFANALRAGNGLAFKWAPREKSARRSEARVLMQALGMTPGNYRRFLSRGTSVVESQMASKEWEAINFSHVPSVASSRYQKAFGRNAGEAYSAYLQELKKPQAQRDPRVKINAAAIHPYEIVKAVRTGVPSAADAQWEALPDFMNGTSVLPMIDTSGSMRGGNPSAIDVALSLGLYVSERNKSAFKDMFLNFSGVSDFQTTKGTLTQRLRQVDTDKWHMNTNIGGAFANILNVATHNNVPAEDMPEVLLILSDMQFDNANRSIDYSANRSPRYGSFKPWNPSAVELATRMYHRAGYELPKLVFWNIRGDANSPVRFDELGTAMISGYSPAIMKSVLSNDLEHFTPYSVMRKTLDNVRYDF